MNLKLPITLFCSLASYSCFSQCFDLYFENQAGSPHHAYMVIYNNNTADMTVQYPDGIGGWRCVYQNGRLVGYPRLGAKGVEFRNPRFCGTSTPNYSYSADNIYWGYDDYGNLVLINLDDGGGISGAWIKQVYCR